MIAPNGSLTIDEKAWNAYPYSKTVSKYNLWCPNWLFSKSLNHSSKKQKVEKLEIPKNHQFSYQSGIYERKF